MRRARTLSMLKRSYRPKFLQCDREAGSAEAGAIRHIGPRRPRGAWLAATLLLAAMGLLLLGSAWEDALTFDEPPHITAGYVSLRFQEAWLNPEHPPLLKLLAALPLLPLPLHFPRGPPAPPEDAAEGWGPQWQLAHRFLYTSGNDPARIAARARLAPIGVTLGLGFALWRWGRRWAGGGAALLALWLYACSPTILAHGRYVTTDLAAAFGVVLAGYSFARFLAAPSCGAALLSALTLGLALLCKFSTVLLVPWFAVLTLLWSVLHPRRCARYLAGLGMVGSGAALLVLLPYLWMTAQYPPAQQLRDTYVAFATGDARLPGVCLPRPGPHPRPPGLRPAPPPARALPCGPGDLPGR